MLSYPTKRTTTMNFHRAEVHARLDLTETNEDETKIRDSRVVVESRYKMGHQEPRASPRILTKKRRK